MEFVREAPVERIGKDGFCHIVGGNQDETVVSADLEEVELGEVG